MGWQHTTIAKTFSVLSTLAVVAIIAVSLSALVMMAHGAKFLSVQSGSMVPTYRKGDLVIDKTVPAQQLAVGDVVTYSNPALLHGQPITHRLVQTASFANGNYFITKGDANRVADPPITAKNIIGQTGQRIPYAGYAADFIRKPLGLAIFVYVPALLVIIAEIRRLMKYYQAQEPYRAVGVPAKAVEPAIATADTHSNAKAVSMASAVVSILAVVIFVPTVHAALHSSVTLKPNTISTITTADHLLVYKVDFGNATAGGSGTANNQTTNITVTNNNSQTATSGNATASGGGNATSGNASNSSSTTIIINGGSGSSPTNPPGNQTVTLYNPTRVAINLNGYKLSDNNSTRSIASGVIAAKGYFVYTWPTSGGLSRSGDHMILRSSTSVGIDSLSWGSDKTQLNPSIITSASTTTITRQVPGLDNDIASDWLTHP